ncbi:uncharacterized protein PHALS_13813 [Plasmopara halstedii]|uniref:Uncharacterized protein n=1 Tax=Plasmopara halstedii TaxID=4781 RepID=A0A0P1ART1_PLAHL|nr:uncharacterized protein PHALS_13813 [Plasmopara halstedii]CEG43622.1 hypothetical protein PHALS_13813 [Plasmopara halstedii]|eukprot:XP_024579991.1 hypothetical protein PHALS_13813 [Plasmopara halstedii]
MSMLLEMNELLVGEDELVIDVNRKDSTSGLPHPSEHISRTITRVHDAVLAHLDD